METKKRATKPTNGQLQKRIAKAVIMLDRTKDTKEVFFSDKGLRLTVDTTEGYALIATGYHTHLFRSFTNAGVSRPFLYIQRLVDLANETAITNAIKTKDGYSYTKLFEVLKAKEDKTEYNIATYIDWWLFNCFQPLYSIGESEVESFLVYEDYLHNIARQSILLSEKKEDMTNKQFFDNIIKNMQEFVGGMQEHVLFKKKTDEEVMQENIEAIQQEENEQILNSNGSKD